MTQRQTDRDRQLGEKERGAGRYRLRETGAQREGERERQTDRLTERQRQLGEKERGAGR